ncbi:hypothetical protein OH76DRAFT_1484942 [Lentinus brumalis]|uniref:Uncharacterized protein n=1 Tax=Lentinus brumalis TaxID=2498619 RepID=A0A371D3I1_9APHY|nr:hypothetical protein OH76DRAFT_1484942 [Polyporus brumalis]
MRQTRLGTSHTDAEDSSTSNLDNPYTAGTIELPDLERSFENTSHRLNLTGAVDATQDIHGVSAADFLFTPDEQAAYFPELQSDILLAETAEELLRAEFERLVLQAQEEDVMGSLADIGSEEMLETASDQLPRPCERAPGVNEGDEQDLEAYLSGIPTDRQFPPYGTKTMFLLHCFMNTPHFRLPVPVRQLLFVLKRS